jgi:hypothetical protein
MTAIPLHVSKCSYSGKREQALNISSAMLVKGAWSGHNPDSDSFLPHRPDRETISKYQVRIS